MNESGAGGNYKYTFTSSARHPAPFTNELLEFSPRIYLLKKSYSCKMGEPVSLDVVEPFGLRWRSHTVFIITTVIIGLFSEAFLYGIITPVLPFILGERVRITHSDLQTYSPILLAVFAGSSAIFSPFSGYIADKSSSRKVPFMVGLFSLISVCFIKSKSDHIWLIQDRL